MLTTVFALVTILAAQDGESFVAPAQIAWQRTLEDARAVAAAEGRPLLVAINLDGESSSDRIVTERYRNPAFVAWTRRFVCAVGHPFRHTLRDHDDEGRRIECPRLGTVTCGEHVALEPAIYDAYLGGDRVSPRHALILPDGTKAFDLYLLFDMRVLDDALSKAAGEVDAEEPDLTAIPWMNPHDERAVLYQQLAGARASWRRDLFERWLREEAEPTDALGALRAVGRVGDAGSVDALLPLVIDRDSSKEIVDLAVGAANERGFGPALGAALRRVVSGAGRYPGSASLGPDRRLLDVLARTTGGDRAIASLLAAHAAFGSADDRAAASAALRHALGDERAKRVLDAIGREDGPVEVEDLLRLAAVLARAPAPAATIPSETPRTMDESIAELEDAERALAGRETDGAAAKRFGLANLALARARIAVQGPDIGLLLQDAATWLANAAELLPEDDLLAIERARNAYLLSRFDDEARIAAAVLARRREAARADDVARDALSNWVAWGTGVASGRAEAERAAAISSDDVACEALRWLGDAHGRMLAEPIDDVAEETAQRVRGARAMASACASRFASDVDYQSLASYLRGVGAMRASLATTRAGLRRFPASNALRDQLRDSTAACGRRDVLAATADWLAALEPESAACAWYAGYAHFLAAEQQRRLEDHEIALLDYADAAARFRRSLELEPGYADSAGHYLALCELGRGFAFRMAGRRQDAADALARALEMRAAIGDVRDGLDREALDLVDACLEWTAEGPSRVDTIAFADALSRAVPGETRWLLAITDATLREGLRADGREHAPIALPDSMRTPGGPESMDTPSALGDAWLDQSVEIARRALFVSDDPTTRRYVAQSLTVRGERNLIRGREEAALRDLEEAARFVDEPMQSGETPYDVAGRLRAKLGEARPVPRPGR